jgi:hypothetical protein
MGMVIMMSASHYRDAAAACCQSESVSPLYSFFPFLSLSFFEVDTRDMMFVSHDCLEMIQDKKRIVRVHALSHKVHFWLDFIRGRK